MKAKFLSLIFLPVVTALLISSSGCISTYEGSIKTDAVIQSNNFKIIKSVSGSAEAVYIIGFGGGTKKIKDGLYAQAKKNMLENNPLQQNQTLTNVTVDVKKKHGVFKSYIRVTISADIVEFTR